MNWFSEPTHWSFEGTALSVTTDPKTDFWRKTHYGFIRDNGHFMYDAVTADFVAKVKVVGRYQALYDQAGLMLRADEFNWLKCGIEYVDGGQLASAVVTRDFSDWSVTALAGNPEACWFKLTRTGDTVEVHYSLDGENYQLLRLAHLPLPASVQIGPMCASPDGDGFKVEFEDFSVLPLDLDS